MHFIRKCLCGGRYKECWSRYDEAHWIECEKCSKSTINKFQYYSSAGRKESIKIWNAMNGGNK